MTEVSLIIGVQPSAVAGLAQAGAPSQIEISASPEGAGDGFWQRFEESVSSLGTPAGQPAPRQTSDRSDTTVSIDGQPLGSTKPVADQIASAHIPELPIVLSNRAQASNLEDFLALASTPSFPAQSSILATAKDKTGPAQPDTGQATIPSDAPTHLHPHSPGKQALSLVGDKAKPALLVSAPNPFKDPITSLPEPSLQRTTGIKEVLPIMAQRSSQPADSIQVEDPVIAKQPALALVPPYPATSSQSEIPLPQTAAQPLSSVLPASPSPGRSSTQTLKAALIEAQAAPRVPQRAVPLGLKPTPALVAVNALDLASIQPLVAAADTLGRDDTAAMPVRDGATASESIASVQTETLTTPVTQEPDLLPCAPSNKPEIPGSSLQPGRTPGAAVSTQHQLLRVNSAQPSRSTPEPVKIRPLEASPQQPVSEKPALADISTPDPLIPSSPGVTQVITHSAVLNSNTSAVVLDTHGLAPRTATTTDRTMAQTSLPGASPAPTVADTTQPPASFAKEMSAAAADPARASGHLPAELTGSTQSLAAVSVSHSYSPQDTKPSSPLGATRTTDDSASGPSLIPAHTTLIATPRVLEVAVPNGTGGWLKVRAEVDGGGGVAASVAASSTTSVEALHKDLPALSAYLKDESVGVSSLVIHRSVETNLLQQSANPSGGGTQGSGAQPRQASSGADRESSAGIPPVHPEPGLSRTSLQDSGTPMSAGVALSRGGWLNVLA